MQIKVFNNLIELNMNNAGVRYFVDNCTDIEKAFIDARVYYYNLDLADDAVKITAEKVVEIFNRIHVSDWQATYSFYKVIAYFLENVNVDQSLIDEVLAEQSDYINKCFIDIGGRKIPIDADLVKRGFFDHSSPVMFINYAGAYYVNLAPKFFGHPLNIVNEDDSDWIKSLCD